MLFLTFAGLVVLCPGLLLLRPVLEYFDVPRDKTRWCEGAAIAAVIAGLLGCLVAWAAAIVGFGDRWEATGAETVNLQYVPSNGDDSFLVANASRFTGGLSYAPAADGPVRVESAPVGMSTIFEDSPAGRAHVVITHEIASAPFLVPFNFGERDTFEFHVPASE